MKPARSCDAVVKILQYMGYIKEKMNQVIRIKHQPWKNREGSGPQEYLIIQTFTVVLHINLDTFP